MQDVTERFWSKVDRGAADDCWNWTAYRKRGYGTFKFEGEKRQAHRVAHILFIGPIPPGMQVDHLCRNPSCVNPGHLEAVTPRENTLRHQMATGRGIAAENCPTGHPYSGENLYTYSDGRRACRECAREANRKYYQRKKAVA